MASDQVERDQLALDNILDRNRARIREIDAVLAELTPVVYRLTRERSECLEAVNRIMPKRVTNQPTNDAAPQHPGAVFGAFIIDPVTKET